MGQREALYAGDSAHACGFLEEQRRKSLAVAALRGKEPSWGIEST